MSLDGIINIIGASLRFAIPCFVLWIIARGIWLSKNKKLYKQVKNKNSREELILNIFIFYILILYGITVYRYGIDFNNFWDIENRLSKVNLILFEEILEMLRHGSLYNAFYNIIGNIVWFIPLGYLIPFICKDLSSIGIIVRVSMLISFSIEIMQFIFRTGISDIDDILFNTIGGMLGYIIFKMGQAWQKPYEHT